MLTETLTEVKRMLSALSMRMGEMDAFRPRQELAEVYLRLLDTQVSSFLAKRILEGIESKLAVTSLKNARVVGEAVRNIIEDMISVGGPIELSPNGHRKIAFIGPTGVGKTSTIAKLAGSFVRNKRLVGAISVDTYKLGATEQLAHFASILRIPLAIVRDPTSPQEVHKALNTMKDRDIVLIDTFGESPKNCAKLHELKKSLELLKPHETHLVLSCTTHPEALLDAIERFSVIHIDRLILTKTDEATKFGLLLNVLEKVSTGLSYIANGQAIPEDIEEATARRVAELVLGERS
jgi:flagellar biosynthesis protein FlhF